MSRKNRHLIALSQSAIKYPLEAMFDRILCIHHAVAYLDQVPWDWIEQLDTKYVICIYRSVYKLLGLFGIHLFGPYEEREE